MPGLGARLGRGGATTFLQDLEHSDCVVIMGANMAENHPVGFRFVVKAREQGATIIHIDPRFTRTSALADIHVPLRAGSDVVFLGALINHVLSNNLYFEEYVRHFTNAGLIVNPDFRDTEDLAGLFSGYLAEERRYEKATWQSLDLDPNQPDTAGAEAPQLRFDPTLKHPRCVLQIVKRHFSRYSPEMVQELCGVPSDTFHQVADAITRNSTPERTTSFAYAVAWTQHTTGTQMISCCALLQLLLGNIGRPGGGIMALRGHATIQGSTDIPTLFNLLPGYLPMPDASQPHSSLADYMAAVSQPTGWWHNAPKYIVSLLKAYYGDNASPENDFNFDRVPKIGGDYSFQSMLTMMNDRAMRGLFCMGQNPAVGGQNTKFARRALAQLDWLVVRDAFETETATFWRDAPEIDDGTRSSADIGTEVFVLPAALTPEKDGSYTNTQRLVQWHDKAVDPPGDARSEAWFIHDLYHRLYCMYAAETSPAARQLQALHWDYPVDERAEPDLGAVIAEINGYTTSDRQPVADFNDLRADGTTACGCWIYSGIMPSPEHNRARDRDGDDRAALGWGFAWPANRRMLYNRASARPDGAPWSERKRWIWWDPDHERWTGHDVPDFPLTKAPNYRPQPGATGADALDGAAPFIMMNDGRGHLFTGVDLQDGPLPTHYEPWETPVENRLYPDQERSPVAILYERPENPYHRPRDPRFPHVLTTYRLTEHHTAGGMSRFLPWLAELQPEGFAEIDRDLAQATGVANGEWVVIGTLRGEIETRVLVTDRLRPLTINDQTLHQIGLPWHFGYSGLARGAIANDLSALVEDPNSFIHEGKAFTCSVRKGRLEPADEDQPGARRTP